jgi:large subunit ribosomal protein L17
MASSLIESKRITTTLAKAKALRTYVEPLITKAKEDTTHSRRVVFSHLQNKDAVSELFREVAVKIGDRPGGYTRILWVGNRVGDNAEMCIIELVDFNETMLAAGTEGEKSKRKRSRRGSSAKKQTPAEAKSTTAKTKAGKKTEEKKEVVKSSEKSEKTVVEEPGTTENVDVEAVETVAKEQTDIQAEEDVNNEETGSGQEASGEDNK